MTREEFETKYAMKYRNLDFIHNPSMTLFELEQNRKGEVYEDHHLDLCWKVQQFKNKYDDYSDAKNSEFLEW